MAEVRTLNGTALIRRGRLEQDDIGTMDPVGARNEGTGAMIDFASTKTRPRLCRVER